MYNEFVLLLQDPRKKVQVGWRVERSSSRLRVLLNLGIRLLLQNEIVAHDSLPHVSYLIYDSLEVRCSVIGASDKDVVRFPRGGRGVKRRYRNEPYFVVSTVYQQIFEAYLS